MSNFYDIVAPLNKHAQRELLSNIYSSEELLWADKPNIGHGTGANPVYYIVGIVCLIAAIVSYSVFQPLKNSETMPIVLFLAAIGIGAILNGYVIVSGARKSAYALTNTRAIVVTANGFTGAYKVESYPFVSGLVKEVRMYGTDGDIIFGEVTSGMISTHVGNGVYVSSPTTKKKGFLRCPNARAIAEFMHEYVNS